MSSRHNEQVPSPAAPNTCPLAPHRLVAELQQPASGQTTPHEESPHEESPHEESPHEESPQLSSSSLAPEAEPDDVASDAVAPTHT